MDAVQKAVSLVDLNSPSRNPEAHGRICCKCCSQSPARILILRPPALLRKAADVQGDDCSSREPLSLPVIRYALYNLAFPEFAVELTPHFLDLLTNIEFYRDMNLDRTKAFFPHIFESEHEVKSSGYLEPRLEVELAQHTHELLGLRGLFWTIVVNCCQHDLYYLATSRSVTDFWLRFNEYLPFLSNAGPSPHKFHYQMTEEEKEMLVRTTSEGCLTDIIAAKAHTQPTQSTSLSALQTIDQLSPMLRLYINSVCRHSELLEEATLSLDHSKRRVSVSH